MTEDPHNSRPAPAGLQALLRAYWYRLLNGPSQSDPLYLSNRTWKQKLGMGLAIVAPVAVVVGIVVYTVFSPPQAAEKPPGEPSAAEIAAHNPIVPKDFTVQQNNELQVVEVGVDRSGTPHRITGVLKNNTNRPFRGAEVSFDLADESGSQIGRAAATVDIVPPRASVPFSASISQTNAAVVLVREVQSRL